MSRPRTKLVFTIGPASIDHVRDLVDLGMSVARVNFSHGTPDEQKAAVHAVRAAAHHARRSVAVLVDLPGRKIRLGELPGGELELETGATFVLRTGGGVGDSSAPQAAAPEPDAAAPEPQAAAPEPDAAAPEPASSAPEPSAPADVAPPQPAAAAAGHPDGATVDHDGLAEQLAVGDRLLLADGAAELTVTAIAAGVITTEVVRGGVIRSRAGVSVPTERLTGPALTAADLDGLARALDLRCDMIGQSFVRSAADVRALRERLPADGPLLVAKIETRAAVDDFDAVAEAADGVMIARGDLGVDLPFAEVPLVQKELISRARQLGRFTIVATQMLESMTMAARPTRAEASDVANAVLDGADALMLSAETAIGAFPLAAAQAMLEIVVATERTRGDEPRSAGDPAAAGSTAQRATIDAAARMLAANHALSAAWCFTRSGSTAQLLADHHPRQPVVAFTLSPVVARRLAVRHGVVPLVLSGTQAGEPLIRQMAAAAKSHQLLDEPALIVLVTTSVQRDGINRIEIQRID